MPRMYVCVIHTYVYIYVIEAYCYILQYTYVYKRNNLEQDTYM